MVLEARLFPYTEARLSCCLSPLVVPCDTGRHTRRLPRHRALASPWAAKFKTTQSKLVLEDESKMVLRLRPSRAQEALKTPAAAARGSCLGHSLGADWVSADCSIRLSACIHCVHAYARYNEYAHTCAC
jgi:hypothetical protein